MSDSSASIDPREFRNVLGAFMTGVTVVTAVDDGQPVGMAVNSFTSVSLDPPLVAFCPAKSSSTWESIKRSSAFVVNILSADQEDVCRVFASGGVDRFADLQWSPSVATGSPVIGGALAHIDCVIDREYDGGDHLIVVGLVREISTPPVDGALPLGFYRGKYAQLSADR